jgi:membrane protein DedA with SNARE-associated domain
MKGNGAAHARLEALYGRYGLWALCLSRFLPGVRALVPPFAGALRISPTRTAVAMGVASGIWYGAITYLAYTVGARWELLAARVGAVGRWSGIAAAALAAIALVVWLVRRRRA